MTDGVRRENEPFDRLTHLAAQMTALLNGPENEDVRAIVMLDDPNYRGLTLHGWEDDTEAMAAMFMHLRAIFRANGKDLAFVPIPDSPEGLEDAVEP